ncbi:hypothetical protein L195_g037539 [Trifolium pratense]|uniref:Uncharacterized protein n=1 Tax=Trifolium pratense TaxID=57577 RepID=A0A2K3LSJ5_TRIPR|nr:hypothetical protein L195_g037539 [Trifolium pratense]
MESKILHESSTKSGGGFKMEEDSTAGGSDVESSFNVEIKVILRMILQTTMGVVVAAKKY